jgi:hypothetical protein
MKTFEIKRSNNFLSKENIKFINEVVLNNNFPFYFSNTFTGGNNSNYTFLVHVVQKRLETVSLNEAINSPDFYLPTLDILDNFLKSVNEKYKFFLRIAYNLTFNNGDGKSQIHKDHNYPHKQIIIYLNDTDPESKTCMVDENNKIVKEIIPKKFEGVCFGDVKHFQYFPKKGFRTVLVATYI